MARKNLMAWAEDERGELLDLLRGLTPQQWEAPSLCTNWRVRDVAVHVVSYEELSMATLARTFLRGGLKVDRVNEAALSRYRDVDSDEVIELVSRCQRPRGVTAAMGGGIALTDCTIHCQDIRRAIALPREIPADRLMAVLDFSLLAPPLPSRRNARGLTLVANDLDWSSGKGPEVTGPGEALLMAAAGRLEALDDLDGEGLPRLRERVAAAVAERP